MEMRWQVYYIVVNLHELVRKGSARSGHCPFVI